MSDREHVDLGRALQWLEGDRRMLGRIRIIFMKNIPDQVQNLGAHLEQGDVASAERGAHTIKGSAAMMGALALSREAGRIEQLAIDRDPEGAKLRFAALVEECDAVMQVLRETETEE
jgi:HPt (histidine-containing phosphotransfer) domain-containing protein